MNEQSARDIVRCSIRIMALLNQLTADLQKDLSVDEFNHQRRLISKIMGDITVDLINPTIAAHSNITLEDTDKWRAAGQLDAPNWLKPRVTGRQ